MSYGFGFGAGRAGRRTRAAPYVAPSYVFTPSTLPAGASLTRSSAGSYHTVAGVLSLAANDNARFDYDPATLAYRGLLLERSASNLAAWSSQPGNAAWSATRLIKTSSNNAAPDGSSTATLFTGNGTSSNRNAGVSLSGDLPAAQIVTQSVYVKAGTQSILQLTGTMAIFGQEQYANFQLTGDGTIGDVVGGSAAIRRLPNGWYRISFTAATIAGATAGAFAFVVSMVPSLTSTRLPSTTLTTTFLAWGASVVADASPASYIETNASAATRAEDFLALDGPTGNWRVTFDDDTTQTLARTASAGKVTLGGAALNRRWVKRVEYLP